MGAYDGLINVSLLGRFLANLKELIPDGGGGDISDLYFDDYDLSLWTIGTLKSADGTDYTSTTRIRTALLSLGVKAVTPKSGYKIAVYVYNASGVYQGMWDGAQLVTTPMTWFTGTVDFTDLPSGSQVRIIAGDTSDSTITAATQDTVAQNIILTRYTDDSLSHSGYPADAAATGTLFRNTLLNRGTLTSSDNLNAVTAPGMYFAGRYSGADGYPTNSPPGFSGDRMRVLVIRTVSGISGAWQLAVDGAGVLWCRGYNGTQNNGSWSAWTRLATPAVNAITLSTTWSGNGPYTQTVTLGIGTPTANSKIDLQPNAAAIAQLIADGVKGLYVENNNGTLTAYAVGAAPTAALTLQVTVTEVAV